MAAFKDIEVSSFRDMARIWVRVPCMYGASWDVAQTNFEILLKSSHKSSSRIKYSSIKFKVGRPPNYFTNGPELWPLPLYTLTVPFFEITRDARREMTRCAIYG